MKKQVGIYKIEAIDNPTVITDAVNSKENLEKYRDTDVNKKTQRHTKRHDWHGFRRLHEKNTFITRS